MTSTHFILWHSLTFVPSIFPSIKVFSNELAAIIRWPNIGTLASASVLPMSMQSWLPLRLIGLVSLLSKGFSRIFSSTTFQRHQILWSSAFFMIQLSQPYVTTGKTIVLTFVGRVMSLLFNILSRFVIAFLPRSKYLLISWLQSPSAVISEPKKIMSVTLSIVSPSICHGGDRARCHDLCLLNAEF